MNLLGVELENFLSHKKTRVTFPSGLIGIVGVNGSGKSSLIKDSVTWALWGESRVSGAGDDLISDDEDSCTSAVTFESGGKQYNVTRTRTRGKKTTLRLLQYRELNEPTTDLTRPVLKATQEEIDKVLGMSYEVFKNSCCIEQGKSGSFSELTPSQASKVLLKILQLDKYENYNLVVSEQLKSLDGKLDTAKVEIGYLQEKLTVLQATETIRSTKSFNLQAAKDKLATCLSEQASSELVVKQLMETITECSKRLMEATSEIDHLGSSLSKLSKQSALLRSVNGSCPLCETHLTTEVKDLVKKKVQDEIDSLMSKIADLEVEKMLLSSTITNKQEEKKLLKLSDLETLIKILTSNVATLEGELTAITTSSLSEESVNADFKAAKERLDSLQKMQTNYQKLREAFGSKGIPLLVIDNTIRELEILINENLKVLSDMPSKVELNTQYESLEGNLIDTFEISIVTNLQKRPYFNYSGGERFIIDLAIRLGLSELLARRNNFKVETLIIDEGLGSLDGTNQVNFFTALTRLVGRFEKILVITHTSVKEYFKNVIEVKNEGGISILDKRSNSCYTSIER